MRKIVVFVGLVFSSSLVKGQIRDTINLENIISRYHWLLNPDSTHAMALAPNPGSWNKIKTRDYWDAKAERDKTIDPFYYLNSTFSFQKNDISVYLTFNKFNTSVLASNIKKDSAQKAFRTLLHGLYRWHISFRDDIDYVWTFPLKGYNYRAVGGNGDGYSDNGYRYLDGNKHGAHPAHDIFINDKNQDCLDDRNKNPVDVLAVDYGIVIACSDKWDNNSNLRGGKYIWIYHYHTYLNSDKFKLTGRSKSGYFTYYAHNNAIFVKPGDEVRSGQKIAEVGRTGYNAYKKRSPTHLHFSAFRLVDDIPVPFNPYQQLKKAKTL